MLEKHPGDFHTSYIRSTPKMMELRMSLLIASVLLEERQSKNIQLSRPNAKESQTPVVLVPGPHKPHILASARLNESHEFRDSNINGIPSNLSGASIPNIAPFQCPM